MLLLYSLSLSLSLRWQRERTERGGAACAPPSFLYCQHFRCARAQQRRGAFSFAFGIFGSLLSASSSSSSQPKPSSTLVPRPAHSRPSPPFFCGRFLPITNAFRVVASLARPHKNTPRPPTPPSRAQTKTRRHRHTHHHKRLGGGGGGGHEAGKKKRPPQQRTLFSTPPPPTNTHIHTHWGAKPFFCGRNCPAGRTTSSRAPHTTHTHTALLDECVCLSVRASSKGQGPPLPPLTHHPSQMRARTHRERERD